MQRKEKHIGIVLHPFGDLAKGLEQYVYETTCAFLRASEKGVTFTVFVKGNPDTSLLPRGTTVVSLPNAFYWNLYLLPWYRVCDVFVFFTESAPLFLWRKSVVVFLDSAYYYFGSQTLSARVERKILVWWRTRMMQSARHVVAISEASKRDLVEYFSVPSLQVSVIYPGFKVDALQDISVESSSAPFFMYVGPMKERKNVLRIVEAYIEFRRTTNFEHILYLVGRQSSGAYASSVLKRIEESAYKDSIVFKTSVDDTELYKLYKTATALVFPSLLEGFGLPILEALSCSCMVITSSTTSTSEVLGNSGFLVNPNNTSEIVKAMVQVAEGDYDKEQFMKEGNLQCHRFSWEKSALEWKNLFSVL